MRLINRLIGWTLIYSILMSDISFAMRNGAGEALTREETVASPGVPLSSRRRLVDPDATGDKPLATRPSSAAILTSSEGESLVPPPGTQFPVAQPLEDVASADQRVSPPESLVIQPHVLQSPVTQPAERQEGRNMPLAVAGAAETLDLRENTPRRLIPGHSPAPDDTQANALVSAHFGQQDGTRRFRADDEDASEVELASSAGERRPNHESPSFDQFLKTFLNGLDPETRASLEKIGRIETSWRGIVRWVNIENPYS